MDAQELLEKLKSAVRSARQLAMSVRPRRMLLGLNRHVSPPPEEPSYPSDILEREDFYLDELYCPLDEVGCFN